MVMIWLRIGCEEAYPNVSEDDVIRIQILPSGDNPLPVRARVV
jgi:hypothetical protein